MKRGARPLHSGSASDEQHGGYSGYSPEGALLADRPHSLWGGRPDAEGLLWIGWEFDDEEVTIRSIRLEQKSDAHSATRVAIEMLPRGSARWETIFEHSVHGLGWSASEPEPAAPTQQDAMVLVASSSASTDALTGELCGPYECHQYDANGKNDWHYVQLRVAETGAGLLWTNRAGAKWSLALTADRRYLAVGRECPYYEQGHTRCEIVRGVDGRIAALLGPWGESYMRHAVPVVQGALVS